LKNTVIYNRGDLTTRVAHQQIEIVIERERWATMETSLFDKELFVSFTHLIVQGGVKWET
jgi:hypothetical protein